MICQVYGTSLLREGTERLLSEALSTPAGPDHATALDFHETLPKHIFKLLSTL